MLAVAFTSLRPAEPSRSAAQRAGSLDAPAASDTTAGSSALTPESGAAAVSGNAETTGESRPDSETVPTAAGTGAAEAASVEPAPASAQQDPAEPAVVAAAASQSPSKTTPEKMARIPKGSSQIIVITGKKLGSKSGRLALFEKQDGRWIEVMNVEANFGKNGLVDGKKRKQGHLQTPTGIWSVGSFVFGLHPSAPEGTKMPYRAIKQNSYWSSARNSTYNTWVNHKVPGEHLIDADPQYEYAFNTGYNSLPNERVLGRGTAIFIHCFEPPGNALGKYTHGCIAVSPTNMVRLFQELDPAKQPVCAIGTLKKGSKTSIWAY